ncbi:hypothetical protein NDU88_002005 [Pleurodeles waltl]|uniref:Uncharacterized protein n=1 Tax=Pleurodeles waltl TaxID=8319 RepID=A0AAV7P7J0_PLEWA|nr:hypothetical protein NDU88_002005 [Pleurodeles waltl]
MRPRLSPAKLIARRSHGGMGLPSVEHYSLALHLSQLSHVLSKVPDPPQWVAVERLLLSANEGLRGPYCDNLLSANSVNPILKASRAAWRRAHRLRGIHPLLHAQAPLWRNSGLRIGDEVLNWPQWKRAGIHTQIFSKTTGRIRSPAEPRVGSSLTRGGLPSTIGAAQGSYGGSL